MAELYSKVGKVNLAGRHVKNAWAVPYGSADERCILSQRGNVSRLTSTAQFFLYRGTAFSCVFLLCATAANFGD